MKHLPILILLFLFCSCKKETCIPFDLEHPQLGFFLFPDYAEEYTYENQAQDILVLTQSSMSYDEETETVPCLYMAHCECPRTLSTVYENLDQDFRIGADFSYDGIFYDPAEANYSQVHISLGDSIKSLDVDYDEYTNPYNEENFVITSLDSLNLNGQDFEGLFEISEPSPLFWEEAYEKIWLKPESGLVAFQFNGEIWTKVD